MSVLWPVEEYAPAALDEFAEALLERVPAAAPRVLPAVMCANCKIECVPFEPCECCGLIPMRAAA